jgi:hypothetical protein
MHRFINNKEYDKKRKKAIGEIKDRLIDAIVLLV